MKPMISKACESCGGEDCPCCEIYLESVVSYTDCEPDYYSGFDRRPYDEDEEEEE